MAIWVQGKSFCKFNVNMEFWAVLKAQFHDTCISLSTNLLEYHCLIFLIFPKNKITVNLSDVTLDFRTVWRHLRSNAVPYSKRHVILCIKKFEFLRVRNFYFTLFKNSALTNIICFLRSIKKVKVILEQAMKAQRRSRGIALRYL